LKGIRLINLPRLTKLLSNSILGNPQRKYEARHELLKVIALRWGFRLYNRNLAWFQDKDFIKEWQLFPETTPTIHERRFNLFNLARSIRHVEGDIAECGVFRGAGSYLMLSATKDTNKQLFGFDSFEGLSEPGQNDQISNNYTFHWKKHDMSVGESIATSNLIRFKERFQLFKGWIPTRFNEVNNKAFCLVHIDVDLYDPTMDTLRFFYPRLNQGGMIICDDYGSEACPGAMKAMDDFAAEHGRYIVHLTSGQGVLFK